MSNFGLDADPLVFEEVVEDDGFLSDEVGNFDAENESAHSINDAAETADVLEKMHDALGESLEVGGVSENEVAALDLAVEHLLSSLGFPHNRKKVFPSMEGFKEKGSGRIRSTKIAMENIKENFNKVWAQIIAALRALWSKAKEAFMTILNESERLGKKANAVREKAKHSTLPPAEVKIKAGHFAKFITINGKFLSAEHIFSAYEKQMNDPLINMDRKKVITDIGNLLKELITESDDKKKEAKEEDLFNLMGHATLGVAGETVPGAKEGYIVQQYKLPFGGYVFSTSTSEGTGMLSLELNANTDKPDLPEEIPALDVHDIDKLMSMVSIQVSKYKVALTHLNHSFNQISTMVDSVKNVASEEDVKVSSRVFNNITSAIIRSALLLRKYDLKVSSSLIDYSISSLSTHGDSRDIKAPE